MKSPFVTQQDPGTTPTLDLATMAQNGWLRIFQPGGAQREGHVNKVAERGGDFHDAFLISGGAKIAVNATAIGLSVQIVAETNQSSNAAKEELVAWLESLKTHAEVSIVFKDGRQINDTQILRVAQMNSNLMLVIRTPEKECVVALVQIAAIIW